MPGWEILAFQPDSNIPDAGRYSALALSSGASLAGPFTIEFVWLGAPGTPGAQPFELNEFDDQGDFVRTLIPNGRTRASGQPTPIPEPGTLLLVSLGLMGLIWLRKRVQYW